jgi:hypothetical protein
MLEYTKAGDGARLAMIVLHDDAKREYAYGPAQGLPETKVGTFTQELYDEAKQDGWFVISMTDAWKRISAFEASGNRPSGNCRASFCCVRMTQSLSGAHRWGI